VSFFVVVRGPLGAGKTTVARALATAIPGAYISIDTLLERDEWDGGSEELFLRTNREAVREARPSLERRVPVVFDGNFYWPRVIHDLGRRLAYPHAVYALRVPLPLCIERDRARSVSYGEEATREVFEKVRPFPGEVPVDGTPPASAVVAAIRSDLARHGLPLAPLP
jgi:tRNA uridine 5-carbamoylmethylation protein Kti12